MSDMDEMDDITRKARLDSILIDTVDIDKADMVATDFMNLVKSGEPISTENFLGNADLVLSCDHCANLMAQIFKCMVNRTGLPDGD